MTEQTGRLDNDRSRAASLVGVSFSSCRLWRAGTAADDKLPETFMEQANSLRTEKVLSDKFAVESPGLAAAARRVIDGIKSAAPVLETATARSTDPLSNSDPNNS